MLRVISKNHTLDQISNFFTKNVGVVLVTFRSGNISLTFEDPRHSHIAYTKYRNYIIEGKKIQLKKLDEQRMQVQQPRELTFYKRQVMENQDNEIINNKYQLFINDTQKKIYQCIYNHFKKFKRQINQKIYKIYEEFQDQQPRNRQINAFQIKIQSLFNALQTKFSNQLKGLNSIIRNFSILKPNVIDIDPSFQQRQIKKKQIDHKNINIQQSIEFINSQKNAIKRILPLNGQEFVISQISKKNDGEIKFYSNKDQTQKKKQTIQNGPYGLTADNGYLFIGDLKGQITFLPLNQQKQISSVPFQALKAPIFDIQNLQTQNQFSLIFVAGRQRHIKIFQIQQVPIHQNLFELQFNQKDRLETGDALLFAFCLLNRQKVVYSFSNKFTIQNYVSKQKRTIHTNSQISRLKKFNENILTLGYIQGIIKLFDIRTQNFVATYQNLGDQLKAIETLNHSIFYGANKTIGLIDDRVTGQRLWKNNNSHTGTVSDIATIRNSIVSGDSQGKLIAWNI